MYFFILKEYELYHLKTRLPNFSRDTLAPTTAKLGVLIKVCAMELIEFMEIVEIKGNKERENVRVDEAAVPVSEM